MQLGTMVAIATHVLAVLPEQSFFDLSLFRTLNRITPKLTSDAGGLFKGTVIANAFLRISGWLSYSNLHSAAN
jgi:hypothetical protein